MYNVGFKSTVISCLFPFEKYNVAVSFCLFMQFLEPIGLSKGHKVRDGWNVNNLKTSAGKLKITLEHYWDLTKDIGVFEFYLLY